MTSTSLDDGDWEVVGYGGNPVPGDPDAVTVLLHQFLNQAGQAQERATRLSSVHASNVGRMQGDYAASFENILASLPAHSAGLGQTYQSCAEALNLFATDLETIQSQAGEGLQRGTEADAAYRAALNEFSSVVPLEFSGTGVWRGLNEATATELAAPMAEETENPEIQAWAAEIGQYAGSAEDDRQAAISVINDMVTQYQEAASRCSRALQNAADGLPSARTSA
jgi:uncharacterized protein YukE